MRKFDPNASDSREFNEKEDSGRSREDSGRRNEEGYARFAKDKRKRIVRTEKNPEGHFAPRDRDDRPAERRSYNPNFTADNRKKDDRPRRNPHDRDSGRDNSRDNYFNSDNYHDNKNATERKKRKRLTSYRSNDSDFDFNSTGHDERRTGRQDDRKPAGRFDKNRQGWKKDGDAGGGKYAKDKRSAPRGGGRQQKYKEFTPGDSYPKYPGPKIEKDVRLNRFIAMSGICSRREADTLIAEGKVTVNGEVVTELGIKITPDDVVRYNGRVMQGESKVYIVMNKPKGYVTTLDDPHAEKTVMDLLKNSVKERVYPVGRLDKNSLGVLLITNDGDMTKKLTHPAYAKKKIYQVSLDKALTKADMQQIADGIVLDDGEIHADQINYVGDSRREIGIEIHSGRNRIVRRIFEHLGYQVQKLDRVYFAGLTKKNLKRGAWRFLSPQEVSALHSGRYE